MGDPRRLACLGARRADSCNACHRLVRRVPDIPVNGPGGRRGADVCHSISHQQPGAIQPLPLGPRNRIETGRMGEMGQRIYCLSHVDGVHRGWLICALIVDKSRYWQGFQPMHAETLYCSALQRIATPGVPKMEEAVLPLILARSGFARNEVCWPNVTKILSDSKSGYICRAN